jgi:hypothetical protein
MFRDFKLQAKKRPQKTTKRWGAQITTMVFTVRIICRVVEKTNITPTYLDIRMRNGMEGNARNGNQSRLPQLNDVYPIT